MTGATARRWWPKPLAAPSLPDCQKLAPQGVVLVGESEELPVVPVPVGDVEDVDALPPTLLVPVPLVLVEVPPP